MNPETAIMHAILLDASRGDSRLFRQNVGMAWAGKAQKIDRVRSMQLGPGDVVIRGARPFHAGIEGMADLGGWHTVTVTPGMVGQRVAVYVAVEVKTAAGRPTPEQRSFIDAVTRAGGRAGVARSVADAVKILAGGADGSASPTGG